MLTSITPLGERGRSSRWGVTTTAYVVTSAVAGALVGLVLGAAGLPLAPSRTAALLTVAVAAILAAALDAVGRRPPGPRRQVDENWLGAYRGWVYGAGFGGQLGVGVVTIVTSATVYAVLVTELVAGPAAGLLIGLAFGLARALPLLGAGRVTTTAALSALHRRVALAARPARWAAVGVAAAVAAGALVGAL